MMILLSPTSYIRMRDAMLVTMRFFDSASSLIQTSVLHGQRFLPDLTPTQFHLRAFFVWFGAFFGCVLAMHTQLHVAVLCFYMCFFLPKKKMKTRAMDTCFQSMGWCSGDACRIFFVSTSVLPELI